MNQNSIWRYVLIVLLVMLGLLYALPNIYGEDYAVQVSATNGLPVSTAIVTKMQQTLRSQGIAFGAVQTGPHNVLVRLKNADSQSKAQDVLQAILGRGYTVALNLAPRTPKWLQALGATPMKLGLDLRGGIHFLLYVDINALQKQRLGADSRSMLAQLRQQQVRYSGQSVKKNMIYLSFRQQATAQQAQLILQKNFADYGWQLSSHAPWQLMASMSRQQLIKLQQYAVTQNITTMRNRVNELGVAEPLIQQQGKDHISVDLPGIQDTARAKNMVGKVATIRMQLVDTTHNPDQAKSSGIVPFGDTLMMFAGHPILLKNEVLLSGQSITSASAASDPENGRPSVSIQASGSEIPRFYQMTGQNVGKPMATVYIETKVNKQIVDGKLVTQSIQLPRIISIATIQQALAGTFQITGLDSMLAAKNLALQLRSGAYIAPVVYVQENVVGPSLGKKNIQMGVLSCEMGSLLVIIFMALYYRLFGLIADVALILNVIFVVAIMSILGATMTLPGIAGIVLTVGMAVDANVLIDERIREELRTGRSPLASIRAGYERAFSTIVDANVTTLIVAIVLFALGTGSVQGFAVTLTIGLLTSMFTAIFITRTIVNMVYHPRRRIKHLSLGIRVKSAKENN